MAWSRVAIVGSAAACMVALAACGTTASSPDREAGAKPVGSGSLALNCSAQKNSNDFDLCFEFANFETYVFSRPGVADKKPQFALQSYTDYGSYGGQQLSDTDPYGAWTPAPPQTFSDSNSNSRSWTNGMTNIGFANNSSAVTYGINESSLKGRAYITGAAEWGMDNGFRQQCDPGAFLLCEMKQNKTQSGSWATGYGISNSPLVVELDNELDAPLVKMSTSAPSNMVWDPAGSTSVPFNVGKEAQDSTTGQTVPANSEVLLGGYRQNNGTSTWSATYTPADGSAKGVYIQMNLAIANQDLSGSTPGPIGGVNADSSTCNVVAPESSLNNVKCTVATAMGTSWADQNQITFRIESTS